MVRWLSEPERWFFQLVRFAEHLETHEWMLALIAAIAAGMFWLQGFGSRSRY